jgi:hypothetical protein
MQTRDELKLERDDIVKGLEEAYKKLIEYKIRLQSPVIVILNGEIVAMDPREMSPTVRYKRLT